MIIALDDWYRPAAQHRLGGHDVRFFSSNATERRAFADAVRDAQALGFRRTFPFRFDRELIDLLPNVQFAHKSGAGADWFDLDALADAGVLVAVNSGFNAAPVAEHSVMLTLMCLRNAFGPMERLRAGVWRREAHGAEPMQLAGKTVGIVGLGEIGGRVARAMLAFDARVIAYQRSPLPAWATDAGIEAVPLDELMRRADIVSLHTPLSPETDGMISAAMLALMNPSAILVNTARGKVVDEAALLDALRSGRIRGAGLDVFAQEPTPADNPLLALDNVVATPHVAGAVVELAAKQAEGTLSNLELFAAGELPERIQNPAALSSPTLRATHLAGRSANTGSR